MLQSRTKCSNNRHNTDPAVLVVLAVHGTHVHEFGFADGVSVQAPNDARPIYCRGDHLVVVCGVWCLVWCVVWCMVVACGVESVYKSCVVCVRCVVYGVWCWGSVRVLRYMHVRTHGLLICSCVSYGRDHDGCKACFPSIYACAYFYI